MTVGSLYFSFPIVYCDLQAVVDAAAITSMMNFTMTIRADRSLETRIIRPAVSEASDVVRLEIRSPIQRNEGSRPKASLAPTIRPRQYVGSNITASLVYISPGRRSVSVSGR